MQCYRAKIVFAGQSGVGKSSILYRFNHDNLPDVSPTIGAALMRKKFTDKDSSISIDIWDTAGQDRYLSMSAFYFRNCNLCLLIFDLGDINSLDALDQWKNSCKNATIMNPAIYFLIGNKSDTQREVSAEMIQDYCEKHDIKRYYETSAQTGDGIYELQDGLHAELFNRINTLSLDKTAEPSAQETCKC